MFFCESCEIVKNTFYRTPPGDCRTPPGVAFHIETSHLVCSTNQITGFYMKCNTRLKWGKWMLDTTCKVSKYGVFSGFIFLYSVQIQENKDHKKLCIWTLFMQCDWMKAISRNLAVKYWFVYILCLYSYIALLKPTFAMALVQYRGVFRTQSKIDNGCFFENSSRVKCTIELFAKIVNDFQL